MFSSFFPNPKLFFPAAVLWTALSMALWYGFARELGSQLSLGGLVGFPYPPANADGAAVAVETARNIWLYQYMIVSGALSFLRLCSAFLRHISPDLEFIAKRDAAPHAMTAENEYLVKE